MNPPIYRYAEEHTSPESDLLTRINRETHTDVRMPRMLSGHLQGRFLSMISRLLRPQGILEIGTYTGYSALCLAEGLRSGGKLITIEVNDELERRVRGYFAQSDKRDQIDFMIGDALEIIGGLSGPFDLVWIDANKEDYSRYYDLVIDKVSPGGCILADNVLWGEKVLDPNPEKDAKALIEFVKKVNRDSRVDTMLLPLRDGIQMMIKN